MNRIESFLLHLSTLLLTGTGLAYAYMHYLLKPIDPFSVVNHPWEPYTLDCHILTAPLLVIGFGMILHSHFLAKMQNGAKVARRSGISLLPLFAVMVSTGYFLQVATSSWRKALVVVHLASGSLWFGFYLAHQISSFRTRRAVAAQNGQRNGNSRQTNGSGIAAQA